MNRCIDKKRGVFAQWNVIKWIKTEINKFTDYWVDEGKNHLE